MVKGLLRKKSFKNLNENLYEEIISGVKPQDYGNRLLEDF